MEIVKTLTRQDMEKALAAYQRRLGEELARRLGVEVAYEPWNMIGPPPAVVQS